MHCPPLKNPQKSNPDPYHVNLRNDAVDKKRDRHQTHRQHRHHHHLPHGSLRHRHFSIWVHSETQFLSWFKCLVTTSIDGHQIYVSDSAIPMLPKPSKTLDLLPWFVDRSPCGFPLRNFNRCPKISL